MSALLRTDRRTRWAWVLLVLVAPLGLMAWAWGGIASFLSHPARVVAVVLLSSQVFIAASRTAGANKGVRHLEEGRLLGLLSVFLNVAILGMAYQDARSIWTLPGEDFLRWTGTALLGVGTVFRVGPMLQLGRRFSVALAIQPDHSLDQSGFYSRIRHPNYLGSLLSYAGFALVFRSALGTGLLFLLLFLLVRRMGREERFLASEFGEEYRSYMIRTSRLIPGVY